jgi:hypothetical protein
LATLAPGTSPAKQSNERNTFVANGARSIQNSYLLDGIDNKNKIVGFDNSSALFRNLRSKPAPFLPSSGKRQGRL